MKTGTMKVAVLDFDSCAFSTIWTILSNKASPFSAVTWTVTVGPWLMVPPITVAPINFSAGKGSPVIIDSSKIDWLLINRPSKGTVSPLRTCKKSPMWISAVSKTVMSPFSSILRAVGGVMFISEAMAFLLFSIANSSRVFEREKIKLRSAPSIQ